jgi:hypothetical protein
VGIEYLPLLGIQRVTASTSPWKCFLSVARFCILNESDFRGCDSPSETNSSHHHCEGRPPTFEIPPTWELVYTLFFFLYCYE